MGHLDTRTHKHPYTTHTHKPASVKEVNSKLSSPEASLLTRSYSFNPSVCFHIRSAEWTVGLHRKEQAPTLSCMVSDQIDIAYTQRPGGFFGVRTRVSRVGDKRSIPSATWPLAHWSLPLSHVTHREAYDWISHMRTWLKLYLIRNNRWGTCVRAQTRHSFDCHNLVHCWVVLLFDWVLCGLVDCRPMRHAT